jgi:hypothetical protein
MGARFLDRVSLPFSARLALFTALRRRLCVDVVGYIYLEHVLIHDFLMRKLIKALSFCFIYSLHCTKKAGDARKDAVSRRSFLLHNRGFARLCLVELTTCALLAVARCTSLALI